MIKFHCPHCNRKMGVPDETAGRRVRCPGCQKPCAVPDQPGHAEARDQPSNGSRAGVAGIPQPPPLGEASASVKHDSTKMVDHVVATTGVSIQPPHGSVATSPGKSLTKTGGWATNRAMVDGKPVPPKEMQVNRIQEITCSGCRHKINISEMQPLSQVSCPDCGVPFQVPCQIGQYILVKRIASGAMGVVYVALDELLNRQVALKVVNAPPSKDDDLYQGTLREARILASLNHPNIAQIYSMNEEMGQPYITMELVDGSSVLELIKKGPAMRDLADAELRADPSWDFRKDPRFRDHTSAGRMGERRTIEIMLDACAGLDYAYGMGYIHRDIKPGNLLLDRHGKTKIIDFGLAETASKQVEGKVMGSPYYMPPEIARGHKADCRADIFSLGATMWHMLAGTPPYQAPTPKEVILKRFKENPGDLAALFGINSYLSNLIAWMMNIAPEDRPADYADLTDKLNKALAKVGAQNP